MLFEMRKHEHIYNISVEDRTKISDVVETFVGSSFAELIVQVCSVLSVSSPCHFTYAGYLYGQKSIARKECSQLKIKKECLSLN